MAPLNYRSPEDCMFFTSRKGFLQTVISVYCHPALDWHPKSLCIASDKTTRNCNYLHWSEIWPSCPLQFGGKSLISFMGRENAGKARILAEACSRGAHGRQEEYLKCFRSRVKSILCSACNPSQENIISFSWDRQAGMRSRRRCFMPLPPSGKVKKEEEMAQLSSQPAGGKPRK